MAYIPSDPRTATRFGLVGCGSIGSLLDEAGPPHAARTHAGAIARSHRAQLIAVCDQDPGRAATAATAWGVDSWFHAIEEMLDSVEVDALSIATPPSVRLPVICAAIRRNIRILWCEKPLADSVEEALEIRRIVREHDIVFSVNFLRRWAPMMSDLRTIIASGRFGSVDTVVGRYGKGLANNGSHMIDVLNALFGPPSSARSLRVVPDGRASDPTHDALLTYSASSKTFPAYLLGTDYRNFQVFELDITLTQGRLRVLDGGRVIEVYERANDPDFSGFSMTRLMCRLEARFDASTEIALEQLLDAATSEVEPFCAVEDGLLALAVVAAVTASETEGKTIELSLASLGM